MDKNLSLVALRIAAFCLFLGRAWQFIFWDAPYRTLLWDQDWMQGIVSSILGLSWEQYASSMTVDLVIQRIILATGFLYLICAIGSLLINEKRKKWLGVILVFGTLNLCFLALLQTKEKFYHFGQFFEHASQLIAPIALIILLGQTVSIKRLITGLKVAVALTFICHGLYAIGYYPRPGVFVDLVINTLGTTEEFAHEFIFIIGVLDILVAILLFVPQMATFALVYTAIWAAVTAFSRVVSGFYVDFPMESLHQSFYLFVYRIPHALIPMTILFLQGSVLSFWKNKKIAIKNVS